MTLGKKRTILYLTLLSGVMLTSTSCSSLHNNGALVNNGHKSIAQKSCNNLSAIAGEKNVNSSYLDNFPNAMGVASKTNGEVNESSKDSSNSNGLSNSSKTSSTASSSSTPTAKSTSNNSSSNSNNFSNVGSQQNTLNGKMSKSYVTDSRGIIKDKNGLIVGVKTESTTFGSGVAKPSSKFKNNSISTIGLTLPKNLILPKSYSGSQNVFDPNLTTGYENVPYNNANSLSLTKDDEANISHYNNVIAHRVNKDYSFSENSCKVNLVKVTVNSGDHGGRVHVSPSFSGGAYGVAANYSTLEGYYVNSGWFRITEGPLKYGYISSALLDSGKLGNGEIASSKLVKIPSYLRKDPKSSSSEYLNPVAARQLILMNAAYRKVFHTNLQLNEGYRPLSTQKYYWKNLPSGVAAKPGTSNHGMALAMDINGVVFQSVQDRWLSIYSQMFGWDRPDYFDRSGSERWHNNFIG